MLRTVIAVAALTFAASAAILPDQMGALAKASAHGVKPSDPALFEEYGFEDAEQAAYGAATVTAWRFRDSTGAMGAFQSLRLAGSKPSKLTPMSVETPDGALLANGNYLIQFTGSVPKPAELSDLFARVPKITHASLPVVSTYLPSDNMVAGSERYIAGPVSLEKFNPGVPPSTVAFHLSAEAQYARYKTPEGEFGLAIFNYPTPNMARERAEAFLKIPGTLAKRTGPMVAVITNPVNADAAERILAKVNYQATVTVNEKAPGADARGFAKSLISMFILAGIIIGFCVVSGLAFAGFKMLSRRFGNKGADEAMITLHIESK